MATYRHWSVSLWRDPDDVSHCRILPLTKLNGGLSRLHSADEDAVSWLTSCGSWHAYEKKKDCPCAPWNVNLDAADPPVGWTNMACFYSVSKVDQCVRQCHMLLWSPERRHQSLGFAAIYFRWKWLGQKPGHKCFDFFGKQPGLDWVNLRLWEKCAGVQDAPGACNTHSAVRLYGSLLAHFY